MDYAVVAVPAAPVRRKPAQYREMVNQLLFGEAVKILKKKKDGWVRVRSLHDDYEGWMTTSLLEPVDEATATERSIFVTTDMLSTVVIGDQPMQLPFGSSLPLFNNGNGKLASYSYYFGGHYFNRDQQKPGIELIRQLSLTWLNVPYLWGGRTPLGVDCSGYIQVIFKLMGIDLPRDAWQQAQAGTGIKKLNQAQPGDLVFFDNKEDIVHVGIFLGNDELIHASGKVKIDQLNKKGILNTSGTRTNKLRAIRRIW